LALDARRGRRDSQPADVRCEFKRQNRDRFVASIMARKKKDRLRAHKEARRLARLEIGMPPGERVIPDKRKKPAKHKKKFLDPDVS
jgi:hypothetical protein